MGLTLNYNKDQTKLSEEEKEGLKIKTITSHAELDEYEQLNIEKAVEWFIGKNISTDKFLRLGFIKKVHQKMFGDVWKWAGDFRKTDKNLGVEWKTISIELQKLLDDTKFWIENRSFPKDEIAIRFKHRIVSIHCFPNGNGRHSRMMADLMIEIILDEKPFSWGNSALVNPNSDRENYIKALKKADRNDIQDLIAFARN